MWSGSEASYQQPSEQAILQASSPTPLKLSETIALTEFHERPSARTTQLSCSQIPAPQELCEIKYACF